MKDSLDVGNLKGKVVYRGKIGNSVIIVFSLGLET